MALGLSRELVPHRCWRAILYGWQGLSELASDIAWDVAGVFQAAV